MYHTDGDLSKKDQQRTSMCGQWVVQRGLCA